MQKARNFSVVVTGATLENDLTLTIPTLDYCMWFFKQDRAVLYLCSTIELSRNYFAKAYRGHNTLKEKGFTVQSSKCGPKAENYIRKMLKEGGW